MICEIKRSTFADKQAPSSECGEIFKSIPIEVKVIDQKISQTNERRKKNSLTWTC